MAWARSRSRGLDSAAARQAETAEGEQPVYHRHLDGQQSAEHADRHGKLSRLWRQRVDQQRNSDGGGDAERRRESERDLRVMSD
jgi:hypothetical protein